MKKWILVVMAFFAGLLLFFSATFICGVPLLWPYYEPEMDGAEIIDPAAWFLPRSNLTPYARFSLGDGRFVNIFSNCYPINESGYRPCALKMRFSVPSGTDVSFAETPVVITSADGENLVNVDFYEKFGDRMKNEIRDGEVFLEYSGFMGTAYVSLSAKAGREYTAKIPDIIVGGDRVALPEIRFVRVDNLTCVGFFSNF